MKKSETLTKRDITTIVKIMSKEGAFLERLKEKKDSMTITQELEDITVITNKLINIWNCIEK